MYFIITMIIFPYIYTLFLACNSLVRKAWWWIIPFGLWRLRGWLKVLLGVGDPGSPPWDPSQFLAFTESQVLYLRTLQLLSMGSRGNNKNFEMKSYDYFHTNFSISLVSLSLNNTRLWEVESHADYQFWCKVVLECCQVKCNRGVLNPYPFKRLSILDLWRTSSSQTKNS